MMWAILLLTGTFLIGAIFKAPEVSEDIQIQRKMVTAKREDLNEMDQGSLNF